MSLRNFIRRTHLLIQQGLYESRNVKHGHQRSLELTRLEERVLFSASAVAPLLAEVAQLGGGVFADSAPANDITSFQINDQRFLDLVADSVLPATSQQSQPEASVYGSQATEHTLELVFLDSSIENLDQMTADLRAMGDADPSRTLEFVILDSTKDGIAQITSALLRYNGIDGMHIVSHGGTGQVQLGSTWLNVHSLDTYRNAIGAWQHSMSDKADILFYGCNLAGSEDGQLLLQEMSVLTDCDVAASEDPTGGINRNADWDLEYQVGTITTDVAFSSGFRADADFILATYTVTNTNDSGAGSLRQAILDANATVGVADTINFNITGSGVHSILLSSTLSITDAVTINATTESDFAGTPLIVVSGVDAVTSGFSLASGSSGSTIRGFNIRDFTSAGIEIQSNNNTIVGNYIGTDSSGNGASGTGNLNGINLWNGANNVIGGTSALDRNVISGNNNIGINLTGSGSATNNTILGNYIGVGANGTTDLGNRWYGIYANGATNSTIGGTATNAGNIISGTGTTGGGANGIYLSTTASVWTIQGNTVGLNAAGTGALGNDGYGMQILSSGNTIGGTTSTARNVISSNLNNGIRLTGASATGNSILGNYIGTSASGLVDLGNLEDGVQIDTGASNNTIGGIASGARNIISGNDNAGIAIDDVASSGNAILGNYIGLSSDGSTAIANTHNGININAAVNTTIGSTNTLGRNVISSNTIHGIGVTDASGTIIIGNYIGLDAAGTTARGNLGDGVRVTGSSSNTRIGGSAAGSANVIANNTGDGIGVTATSSTAATILGNSIYSNGEQGIDLGADDGLTFNDINDSDSGSNGLLNFPILRTASSAGGNTSITGDVRGLANTTFRVEFFANGYGQSDTSGYGEARTYLGSTTVTTDATGKAAFTANLIGVTLEYGSTVTSTATVDLGGGNYGATSEFAGNILAYEANLMVTGTYVGTGVDNRTFAGLGFRPEVVIIMQPGNGTTTPAYIKTSTMAGDASKSMYDATVLQANYIQTLNGQGFEVGTALNTNAATYHWLAFGAGDQIDVGAYTGNSSTQTISNVGFNPDMLFAMSASTQSARWESSLSTNMYDFYTGNYGTAGITGFNADGFTLG
jgi:hypothetical protein